MGVQLALAGANFQSGKIIRDDIRLDVGSLMLLDFTHSSTQATSFEPARGAITFPANPAAGATITLNTTVVTFVASGAVGNQVNIGADLATTLTNLTTFLNGSADPNIALCSYSSNATSGRLGISYKTAGLGNNFAIAASAATTSAPTLYGQSTPADQSQVTNLAWREAAKILPGLTEAQARWQVTGSSSSTGLLFQRSSKGSLVGMPSKVSAAGSKVFSMPDVIKEYVRANPARNFAMYVPVNQLRQTTSSNCYLTNIGSNSSYPNNNKLGIQQYQTNLGEIDWSSNGVQNGWNGAVPASINGMVAELVAFNNTGVYRSLASNNTPSFVMRSAHFVDMTAWTAANPGKTSADWFIQQRAYTTQFLAAGGRWFGDTWTLNPANYA